MLHRLFEKTTMPKQPSDLGSRGDKTDFSFRSWLQETVRIWHFDELEKYQICEMITTNVTVISGPQKGGIISYFLTGWTLAF